MSFFKLFFWICCCYIFSTCFWIKAAVNQHTPQIAYHCELGAKFWDVSQFKWKSGRVHGDTCFGTNMRLGFDFCKKAYPSSNITNVIELPSNNKLRFSDFCEEHDDFYCVATILQCVDGDYKSPMIQIDSSCWFARLGPSGCSAPFHWRSAAQHFCHDSGGKPRLGNHAYTSLCGLNQFQGIIFECCPEHESTLIDNIPEISIASKKSSHKKYNNGGSTGASHISSPCHLTHVGGEGYCAPAPQWLDTAQQFCLNTGNTTRLSHHYFDTTCGNEKYTGVSFVCCPDIQIYSPLVDVAGSNNDVQHTLHEGAASSDICSKPVDGGPCRAYVPSYYYNMATGQCQLFTYGGCGGNENRFETKIHCLNACHKEVVCSLRPDPGLCNQYSNKYYYDEVTQECLRFSFGGCEGNANRFDTYEDCIAKCNPLDHKVANVDTSKHQPTECQLTPDTGPCQALIPMHYYDVAMKTCSEFYYSGCGGNENRFTSMLACQQTCAAQDTDSGAMENLEISNLDDKYESEDERTMNATEYKENSQYTAANLSNLKLMSDDTYLKSDFALEHEHRKYKQAQHKLELIYSDKMSQLMMDYEKEEQRNREEIDRKYVGQLNVESKKAEHEDTLSKFQKMVASVEEQFELDRQELHETHRKRMQVALETKKANAVQDLTTKLRNRNTNSEDVFTSFITYITVQQEDMNHELRHYGHLVVTSASRALKARKDILKRLSHDLTDVRLMSEKLTSRPDVYEKFGKQIAVKISEFESFYNKIHQEIMKQRGVIPGFVYSVDENNNYESNHLSQTPDSVPNTVILTQAKEDAFKQALKSNSKKIDDSPPHTDSMLKRAFIGSTISVGLVAFVAVVSFAMRDWRRSSRLQSPHGKFSPVATHMFENDECAVPPTVEERSIALMQQNGYENPTYKFFDGK